MKIMRDGAVYTVVDETETDYAVEFAFLYEEEPRVRILKMWWSKELCKPITDGPCLNCPEPHCHAYEVFLCLQEEEEINHDAIPTN